MASCSTLIYFVSLVIVLLMISDNTTAVDAAEEFEVGDAQGWRQPPVNHTYMYTLWASTRKFHVGDSLRFMYKNDSVLVVDKWGFYHCNSSTPNSVFNDGNSLVNLDQPGSMYFISGDPDHCKNGQKLLIEVLPLHPISQSPPPQPDSEMSSAPSPISNSGVKISVKVVSASMVTLLAALFATLMA